MKNTFGNIFNITIFGESHGEQIGVVIDGIAPGIKLDLEYINKLLDLRKPKGKISTQRKEADEFKIVSGYFNGYTTGTPLTILIENSANHSKDYEATKNLMRPSHADYTAQVKYNGYQDYRGGGHFSGRITAPLVVAGAIALQILKSKGIEIGTHIKQLGEYTDREFNDYISDINELTNKYIPILDDEISTKVNEHIEKVFSNKDSIGGILETVVYNLEAGIGEPFFDSLESKISHGVFSIPAVKGIEFGLGFDFAKTTGYSANDSFSYENDKVITTTNNNGGINGGISNGMPIIFRSSIKPTPSIYSKQDTININTKTNETIEIVGRHDPAIIHRARIVIDSITAITVLDSICERYGYMWMV